MVKRPSFWVGFFILGVVRLHLPQGFLSLEFHKPISLPCSGQLALAPSLSPAPGPRPVGRAPRGSGPHRYVVLRLTPGGLRLGRPPLQPRVQLEERSLQRGDFSLWLRPARRTDAGEYSAAVQLRDRALACRLRLRVGQASSTWGGDAGAGLGAERPPGRQEGLGPSLCF